jgi:site-specific DNA-methyltransferase (adenine-specific)
MTDRYENIRLAPGADDVSPVVIGNATLYLGDCLELMKQIPDGSVDLVLCDLPYGTTACKWDAVIPFEPLWAQYRRVAKRNAAIVLTANHPFTAMLVASNLRDFRYAWVWEKSKPTGHLRAKLQPMRAHEDVLVFGVGSPRYYPQGLVAIEPRTVTRTNTGGVYRKQAGMPSVQSFTGYPRTVLRFGVEEGLHPTQKPVALMEYLIRTYTNEGEVVLDNCMGSGTTGVACANTGRRFIGIELEPNYFQIARRRIEDALGQEKNQGQK